MTTNGCYRKCPCRLWLNCLTYVDKQRQAWRLKRKEQAAGIKEFYDSFGEAHMPDFVMSG